MMLLVSIDPETKKDVIATREGNENTFKSVKIIGNIRIPLGTFSVSLSNN